MNTRLRQTLAALAVLALFALALGGMLSVALSLEDARVNVGELDKQLQALLARERRSAAAPGRDQAALPSFEARTVTQAGAAVQQRVETAIANAKGRLVSSRVDIETSSTERRIGLVVELTIADAQLQSLLFDLETARPYLFVDTFEARLSESPGDDTLLDVSLGLSGRWSGEK